MQTYIKNKFIKAQFLWLKCEFISEADAEAKKALILVRSLQNFKTIKKTKREKENKDLSRTQLIKEFSSYDYKQIIKASITIATKEEREVLNLFLKGNYDLCRIKTYSKNNIDLFKFIYEMISDNKKAFLSFIIATNSNILHNRMKMKLPNVKLEEKILLINEKFKNKKRIS